MAKFLEASWRFHCIDISLTQFCCTEDCILYNYVVVELGDFQTSQTYISVLGCCL